MTFENGFEFNGIKYGWHKKKLFRLPIQIGKRFYSLKEMKMREKGKVWNIYNHPMTINQLKDLTNKQGKVDWEVVEFKNNDTPF